MIKTDITRANHTVTFFLLLEFACSLLLAHRLVAKKVKGLYDSVFNLVSNFK